MTDEKVFVASPEAKSKAKTFRIIAIVAWLLAIAAQIYAIMNLLYDDMMTWLIVMIVVILILAFTGNMLWKKANRLDPASEADGFQFFIQNQFGAIMSVLAFLPLVLLIFTNKDMDGKTKGIAGGVAVVALLIASLTGIDFDPASIEKYTEEINAQTETLKTINAGTDLVYWTRAGNKYHVYEDCYHIEEREKWNGTVKESWEQKGISELCKTCKKRVMKENNIPEEGE